MPAALAYVYCSATDVQDLLSVEGYVARLDDDDTGQLSAQEAARMDKAIQWATARCNFYLLAKHASDDLSASWVVNEWATILAAYWLSIRRGNPPAGSLKELYDATIEDMRMVRSGEVVLPDVGLREAAWPAWSNVIVERGFPLAKVRVQRPLSERTPQKGPFRQHADPVSGWLIDPY